MVDPIFGDELNKRRRMRAYEEYQNYLDDKEEVSSQITGKIQDKTVKKLAHNPLLGKIFRNSFDKL